VVEPPSRRLQQILLGLKLCSPRDLRRCASRVKTLSADLPAFDSVWLDALVQRRVLTSWQAQTIEAELPELLRIGPCVVEDRIGQSHRSATYLARLPGKQGQCVIKRVIVPAELGKFVSERLKHLIDRSQGISQPGILIPHSMSEISSDPLTQLESSEKLKESAATRASRQTSVVSTLQKRGSKAGVSRARRKNRSPDRQRSDKLNTELAVVSRLVDGLSLSEILLRRGRLPARDVDAIARQLLESLAALHEAGIVHGEILLSNIRLLPSGQAVLVDAGIRPALQPEFQINAHVAPEQNDGIAPELIGTGTAATPRSDLYALGFALWHLLAGRPAFPTGDPLAKLAAHQTERIPDIREFAPDTPDRLAMMIEWITEPVASHRPRSAKQLLADGSPDCSGRVRPNAKVEKNRGGMSERVSSANKATATKSPAVAVKPAGRSSRRRLTKFAAGFQQPVRRNVPTSSFRRTAKSLACATAAMIIAVAALLTFDARSRNLVLATLPQRFVETIDSDTSTIDTDLSASPQADSAERRIAIAESAMKPVADRRRNATATPLRETQREPGFPVPKVSQLLPLPEPDPYGVVLLSELGRYDGESISWSGSHLILRGTSNAPARITLSSQTMKLRATEVTLENIEFSLESATSTQPSMTQIQSQKLTCLNCSFITPLPTDGRTEPANSQPALDARLAIQWIPIDAYDPLAGELNFQNCQFAGSHSTIMLTAPGRMVRCENTLKVGGGPLFIATDQAASGDNTFEFKQTTVRDSGSLIAVDLRNVPPWNSRLTIKPESSVFDLRRRSEKESESLITFVGGRLQLAWHERVTFEGDDSVASSAVGLASWQAGNGDGHQALDASEVSVQGLMQTEFTFQGTPSLGRVNSVLSDVQTNRSSSRLPGISPETELSTPKTHGEMILIVPETGPDI
jgi:serine/threonine protein kinase